MVVVAHAKKICCLRHDDAPGDCDVVPTPNTKLSTATIENLYSHKSVIKPLFFFLIRRLLKQGICVLLVFNLEPVRLFIVCHPIRQKKSSCS